MKKLPVVLGILLAGSRFLLPACEVENCPPNALAYAQFAFVDQSGQYSAVQRHPNRHTVS